MALFKRIWRLKIQIGNVLKTYQELTMTDTSLKIEFELSCAIQGAFPNGTITVYGLTNEDMQVLASGYSFVKHTFTQNFVSLEVGYLQTGLSTLFKGNFMQIEPNFSVLGNSIILHVAQGIGNNLENNNISTSVNGRIAFKGVCAECAKNNGLTLDYDKDIPARFLTDYAFNGTPFQQLSELQGFYDDIDIFIVPNKDILRVQKSGKLSADRTTLSNKTGLLSKPKPTTSGLQVISMLNTNLIAGGTVKLKNEVLTSFDGVYRIFDIKHMGGNRGDTWISQLTLQQ